jgi:hypothetical protein
MPRYLLNFIIAALLFFSYSWSAAGQTIESSPSKSVKLFFTAVDARDYEAARKFIPRSVVRMLENEFQGGFRAFIDQIASENEGSRLEVENESIDEFGARVETVTITSAGKRIQEKWILRLEDNLWKLDILIPR